MGVLGSIFGFGDQIKRNIRDFASNPKDYVEGAVHQNNIEWKKDPVERSLGFFNPVPLGTMGNFVIQKKLEEAATNLSRREFMKKSAGLAGGTAAASVPGAKLLQKFAPEERAIAKEAVVEAAPKYKYNSLKEYLDDVQMWAKEDYKAADLSGQGARYSKDEFARRQLLNDEALYKEAKAADMDSLVRQQKFPDYEKYKRSLDSFSPQAKQEMKALKELHGDDWVSYRPDSYYDDMGIIQGRPQYNFDGSPRMSSEFYWNGTKKLDNQFEHLNPRSPGYNFWDETGGYGLQDGAKSSAEMRELFKKYVDEWL